LRSYATDVIKDLQGKIKIEKAKRNMTKKITKESRRNINNFLTVKIDNLDMSNKLIVKKDISDKKLISVVLDH